MYFGGVLAAVVLPFLFSTGSAATRKNIIVDTDLFSDVDDAAALLLAATLPDVNLLAVNINYPSSYSVLAASAILSHYGQRKVPIGLRRPITNETFFDGWSFELGEYASKVAYHWSGGSLTWGNADQAWEPVDLYRRTLAAAADGSVTIASIGFLENLSGLLNSSADRHSPLSGWELVSTKVAELVLMGGAYPNGHEYNFWGDNPAATAHVVNSWPGAMVFLGDELGGKVASGAHLSVEAPVGDPVAAAFRWYVGFNTSRMSWDPLTVLYAARGLGDLFEYANEIGYNHVYPNGSNTWVNERRRQSRNFDQKWLKLRVDNTTAGEVLDNLYLKAAMSWRSSKPVTENHSEL